MRVSDLLHENLKMDGGDRSSVAPLASWAIVLWICSHTRGATSCVLQGLQVIVAKEREGERERETLSKQ